MSERVKILYLSRDQVQEVGISMGEVLETVEGALHEQGMENVDMPPTLGVLPHGSNFIHAMPAFVPAAGAVGCKWVTVYGSNIGTGYELTMGLLVLNDVEYGAPRCVMDCAHVTALRTGACAGVGAKYLARPDARTLGIVGAGKMARMALMAVHHNVPTLQETSVYDIRKEAAVSFKDEMQPLVGSNIKLVDHVSDAVDGRDIIVSATRVQAKPEPFIKNEWLKEGALALPIDIDSAWEPEAVLGVDKFVIDYWESAMHQAHGKFPVRIFQHGVPELHAELGQIVCGKRPGRETDSERIMDINCGMGILDVTVGTRIQRKAIERGIGTWLDLY